MAKKKRPNKSGAAKKASGAVGNARDAAKRAAETAGDARSQATGAIGGKAAGAAGKVTGAASDVGGKVTGSAGKLTGAAAATSAAGAAATRKVSKPSLRSGGSTKTTSRSSRTVSTKTSGAGRGGGGWSRFLPPNARGKFPWKWRWLGLVPLLGLFVGAGIWAWTHMENNMQERAIANLTCEGIDPSGLDLDWSYRNVDVDGVLPAGFSAADIERIIDEGSDNESCLEDAGVGGYDGVDDPGVRDVDIAAAAAAAPVAEPDPTAVPVPTATAVPEPTATAVPEPTATPQPTSEPEPTAEPIIAALAATAVFNGESIVLTGEVANEAHRDELVAAAIASVGEANVVDQLTIADGEPSSTADVRVSELASVIAEFSSGNIIEGEASISDAELTYRLTSPTQPAKAALGLAGSGIVTVPSGAVPEFTG